MNKNICPNRWFIWAIIGIVVIGIGILGYMQYVISEINNDALANKFVSIPQEKLTDDEITSGEIIAEITASEKTVMSDWKTYQNEEYGFEIKYPSYYDVYGLKRGAGNGRHQPPSVGDDKIILSNSNTEKPGRDFNIYIALDQSKIDWIYVWETKSKEVNMKGHGEASSQFLGTTTFMGFTVGLDEWCDIGGCSTIMTVPKDKTAYQLEIKSDWDLYTGNKEENLKIRDQILSFFQFID